MPRRGEKAPPLSELKKQQLARSRATQAIVEIEKRARLDGAAAAVTALESAVYAGVDPLQALSRASKQVQAEIAGGGA
jgi:hypothetical protein